MCKLIEYQDTRYFILVEYHPGSLFRFRRVTVVFWFSSDRWVGHTSYIESDQNKAGTECVGCCCMNSGALPELQVGQTARQRLGSARTHMTHYQQDI